MGRALSLPAAILPSAKICEGGQSPVLVLYDSDHFERSNLKADAPQPAECTRLDEQSKCGEGASGCAAASVYLDWYPPLRKATTREATCVYHTSIGQRLDCMWLI